MEEEGGENLYGFVRNDPLSFVDILGECDTCTCKELTVTPSDQNPKVDFYHFNTALGTETRFGFVITATWTVEGNPNLCHYYVNEPKGGVTGSGPYGKADPSVGTGGEVEVGQTVVDTMGLRANKAGKYKVKINLKQTYKCKSSDRTTKQETKKFKAKGEGQY